MIRNCIRVALLGLLAAVSTTTAQRANYTDLSGHYIEYDLITMSVQTQMEALEPVVKALAKPSVDSIYAAWISKFQKAAKAGTMSVQENSDNLASFLSSAALEAPTFAADSKIALSKAVIDYFTFHPFMPAATYDVVEYGIVRLSTQFNFSSLDPIKAYMTKNVNTAKVADLQFQLNAFLAASEGKFPGFKAAVIKELNVAYQTVWNNNPVRAPTSSPTTTTATPSATSTSPTRAPNSSESTTNSSTTSPPTSPELFIGEPLPEDESGTTAPAVPTPAPTTKASGASGMAVNVVIGVVVFAATSALL